MYFNIIQKGLWTKGQKFKGIRRFVHTDMTFKFNIKINRNVCFEDYSSILLRNHGRTDKFFNLDRALRF